MDINIIDVGVDHDKIILLSIPFPTIPMLGTYCWCNVIVFYVGNKRCCIVSSRVVSCLVASRRVALHCIALNRVASHRIASDRIASHRIASHRIASHRIASHRIVSYRIVLYIVNYTVEHILTGVKKRVNNKATGSTMQ